MKLLQDLSEFPFVSKKKLNKAIKDLNKRINKIGYIYGETLPLNNSITSINATHSIKDIRVIDNKIYGEVSLLEHSNELNKTRRKNFHAEPIDCIKFKMRFDNSKNKIYTFDIINE